MPLYEYQCTQCQHCTEVLQKIGDPAPACPECQGETRKLVSAPSFKFKGSGWYVTDYADKGKSGKSSDSASSSESKSSSDSGSSNGGSSSDGSSSSSSKSDSSSTSKSESKASKSTD